MSEKNSITRAWRLYEKGRAYNNQLSPNQYRLVNTNIEFFVGNQWIHLPQTPAMSRLPKPVFNIIKRVTSLFVASLTSAGIIINFEPLSYYDGGDVANPDCDAARFANAEVRNLLEKFKMDYRIRDALFDGAQTGDYCAHFYFDPDALPYGGAFGAYKGEIMMEMVDGINVMFGNPNTPIVEKQPYILIVGRDTCDNLAWEASRWARTNAGSAGRTGRSSDGSLKSDSPDIFPDRETDGQAGSGGRIEIPSDDGDGKALYVYLYTKVTRGVDDGGGDPRLVTTVHVTKATRTAVIYEDVDTGLTRYPVAWGNWEKQKNQYHGRALITGIIPNQIYINSQFAMVMRHLQLLGYPKTVYNADLVGQWSNEIGQAIGVRGLAPGQSIGQVAANLQPADMSNQILTVIDKAIQYTKDCLGATDAQMGNVRPDNTSALMVLQSSAEVPLENTRAGLYEWMEEIGAILLDMMGTYYGERPIVREREFEEPAFEPNGQMTMIDPVTGTMMINKVKRKVIEMYDFNCFKHLWLNMRIDAGATSYYSEIAMTQTLDNLRQNGVMDTVQYLERMPDKLIPRRQELIDELKKAAKEGEWADSSASGSQGENLPAMGGALSDDKALSILPGGMQEKYKNLPSVAKRTVLKKASITASRR